MAEETVNTEEQVPEEEQQPVYGWAPQPGKRPQLRVAAEPYSYQPPHPFEFLAPSEY